MAPNPLFAGFTTQDQERAGAHLMKLFAHIDPKRIALVGGMAINYHLATRGLEPFSRPFNDLDIIAREFTDVPLTVTKDFLVSHCHQYPPGKQLDRWYIVLIDPVTKTKVDIFDWQMYLPDNVLPIRFDQYDTFVQSAEDQLTTTVLEALRVLDNQPAEPKKLKTIELLRQITDPSTATTCYEHKKVGRTTHPEFSLSQAIRAITQTIAFHPELLVPKIHRKPEPYECPDCRTNTTFPLTPLKDIYELMGYVE